MRACSPHFYMGDSLISGILTHSDCKLHINTLELKAVILALHHWVSIIPGHQVMIGTNNTSVVAYTNKQGGTHSHTLSSLVVDLILWLQTNWRHSHPGQTHSGLSKHDSDRFSRPNQPIKTEWSLHPEIVSQIIGTRGTLTVDMFATVHNMHFWKFKSPILTPGPWR